MNDHVYLFTDASFKYGDCHTNLKKRNLGSISYIFNKDRKKHVNTMIVENCKNNNEAEALAVRYAIKNVISVYKKHSGQKPKVKVFTDSLSVVKYMNEDLSDKRIRKRKKNKTFAAVINEIKFMTGSCEHEFEFIHIPGHQKKEERKATGHFNAECDSSARIHLKKFIKGE